MSIVISGKRICNTCGKSFGEADQKSFDKHACGRPAGSGNRSKSKYELEEGELRERPSPTKHPREPQLADALGWRPADKRPDATSPCQCMMLTADEDLIRALYKNGLDNKMPVSALQQLALTCEPWPDKDNIDRNPRYSEESFASYRQWTVRLPPDGSLSLSARGKMPLDSRFIKHLCALRMIVRVRPLHVRTWGELLDHLKESSVQRKAARDATEQVTPADATGNNAVPPPPPMLPPATMWEAGGGSSAPAVADLCARIKGPNKQPPDRGTSAGSGGGLDEIVDVTPFVDIFEVTAEQTASADATKQNTKPLPSPPPPRPRLPRPPPPMREADASGYQKWPKMTHDADAALGKRTSHSTGPGVALCRVVEEVVRAAGGEVFIPNLATALRDHQGELRDELGLTTWSMFSDMKVVELWLTRCPHFVTEGRSFSGLVRLADASMSAAAQEAEPVRTIERDAPLVAKLAKVTAATTMEAAACRHFREVEAALADGVAATSWEEHLSKQPKLTHASEETRCRFLRVDNVPHDASGEDVRALIETHGIGTVEEVEVTADHSVLLTMACTREAVVAKRHLSGTRYRGYKLDLSFDTERLPVPAVATADSQTRPSTPPLIPLSSSPPPQPPQPSHGPAVQTADGHASHEDASYVRGHTDAARDIYANAEAQVAYLLQALDEEREQELDAAIAALRSKYESRMQTAVREAARHATAAAAGSAVAAAAAGAAASAAAVSSHDEERLIRRQLALRQYFEMRRVMLGSKATAKLWRLTVRRPSLLGDVLEAFGGVSSKKRALLFCATSVTFHDAWGDAEEGQDEGGLTAEMFSLFWTAVRQPAAGLFAGEQLLLPSPSAPTAQLEAVGVALCKCLLDDHPIGAGFAGFVYDWLVSGEESHALHDTPAALHALADLDAQLSSSWEALLAQPSLLTRMHLTFDCFVASATDTPVTAANLEVAVLAGCRHRLLDSRRDAMDALRRGFTRGEDLSVQLAAFELPELMAMVQGQAKLSADELLSCFLLPSASEDEAIAAGFDDVDATVAIHFEALLRDGVLLTADERLTLLHWCTALTVLPFGGLRECKIRLRLYGPELDDETLPETHTCTRELHLPNYSSAAVLHAKLRLALEHAADGFHKQ